MFGVLAYRPFRSAIFLTSISHAERERRTAGRRSGDDGVFGASRSSGVHDHRGHRRDGSSSSTGNSNVTLQFDLGRNIDSAAVDVQTAIAAVMPLLPAGMPSPPSFRKFNPADQPIMYLGLTSETQPMSVLDDYAETQIAPRISMVSGVSQVQVQGAQKYAVRVQVDPQKLQAEKVGLNEVNQALQNWNVNCRRGCSAPTRPTTSRPAAS